MKISQLFNSQRFGSDGLWHVSLYRTGTISAGVGRTKEEAVCNAEQNMQKLKEREHEISQHN